MIEKILIATSNPAKFDSYKNIINDFSDKIDVFSLYDLNISEKVEEDQDDIVKNAVKKALFYRNISNIPTLAIDESFFIDYLPKDKQPGLKVRRCIGKTATDQELLNFYLDLIKDIPEDKRTARFISGIALVIDKDKIFTGTAEIEQFFSEKVFPYRKGYPLGAICIDAKIKKPVSQMSKEELLLSKTPIYAVVKGLIEKVK